MPKKSAQPTLTIVHTSRDVSDSDKKRLKPHFSLLDRIILFVGICGMVAAVGGMATVLVYPKDEAPWVALVLMFGGSAIVAAMSFAAAISVRLSKSP